LFVEEQALDEAEALAAREHLDMARLNRQKLCSNPRPAPSSGHALTKSGFIVF
jgi:hypothetical protein